MEGQIIVIEGLDGSGKGTQSKLLVERLENENYKVKHFEFPNYNSKSAWLVNEYLSGNFSKDYKEVDFRVACMTFAIDRLITYRDEMKKYLDDGYTIICDRWVTANLLHQTIRSSSEDEIDEITKWIETLEYDKFELPKPYHTFFLKVPYEYSYETAKARYKNDGSIKNDIHEVSLEFLKRSYENGLYVSKKYDWDVIECYTDSMRSIEDIHEEIYDKVTKLISK
ncbi:MAG: deoxynucleoside kinase [Clostridia bacterium]|nr:deoxynucleoside kinase [Clostridia bacterium]